MSKGSKEVSESLFIYLASTYGLYLKTQNFHWNVTGPSCIGLHELFQKQYEELAEAIDEVAERVAILEVYVNGSFSEFSKHSIIEEAGKNLSSKEMLEQLVKDHKAMSKLGNELVQRFPDLGDEVSTDLIIGRLTFHDKSAWILENHLR